MDVDEAAYATPLQRVVDPWAAVVDASAADDILEEEAEVDTDLALPPADGASGAPEVVRDAAAMAALLGHGAGAPIPASRDALLVLTELVQTLEDVARQRARELERLARVRVTQASRCQTLQQESAGLDAEAATWRLLDFMCDHRSPHQPTPEAGGPSLEEALQVPSSGTHRTTRQAIAALLGSPGPLQHAARVVVWLESLADEKLREEEGAPGGGMLDRIHADHGAWGATKATLLGDPLARARALQRGGMVASVDPDVLTREPVRHLHSDDAEDSANLMHAVWTVVRAGRFRDAVRVLGEAGQPWRAATLLACGPHGPTPLGAAADALTSESLTRDSDTAAAAAEDVIDEVLGDEVGMQRRGLWRFACREVAESARARLASAGEGAATAPSQRADAAEASLYGVLAGSALHALAYGVTWEDACWALARCALECGVDAALSDAMPEGLPAIDEGLLEVKAPAEAGAVRAAGQRGWPSAEVAAQSPSLVGEAGADGVTRLLDAMAARVVRGGGEVAGARGGGLRGGATIGDAQVQDWQLRLMSRDRRGLLLALAAECQSGTLGSGEAGAEGAGVSWKLRAAAHVAVVAYLIEAVESGVMEDSGDEGDEGRQGMAVDDGRGSRAARERALEELGNARDVVLRAYMGALVSAGLEDLVPIYARHYGWVAGPGGGSRKERVLDFYDPLFTYAQEQGRAVDEWRRMYKRGCHWVGHAWMHRAADLRASTAAAAATEAPTQRVDALRWLSFSWDARGVAADLPARANAILRVLGLSASVDHIRACQSAFFEDGALSHGGRPPALGPWLSQLLKQDPAEWGDVLTQIGVGEGVVDELLELRCWREYLSCERALRPLTPSLAPEGPRLEGEAVDAARDVLAAMLEVLWGGWGLGSDMGVAAGRDHRLTLWGIPSRVASGTGQVPVCFPRGEAEALAAAMTAHVRGFAPTDAGLTWSCEADGSYLGPSPGDLAGIAVRVSGPDAAAVVALAARVVKGEVPVDSQEDVDGVAREPLRVLALSSSSRALERALCRTVVAPRMALHCARLRAALARVSPDACHLPDAAPVATLGEVLGQPRDTDGDAGLSALLSPAEALEILTLERATAFCCLPG